MAGAAPSSAVVYENQWKWVSGWRDTCDTHSRPRSDDVYPWSDKDGRVCVQPWTDGHQWSVDFSGTCDGQGWRYSESFAGSEIQLAAPLPSWAHPVRRRRWCRGSAPVRAPLVASLPRDAIAVNHTESPRAVPETDETTKAPRAGDVAARIDSSSHRGATANTASKSGSPPCSSGISALDKCATALSRLKCVASGPGGGAWPYVDLLWDSAVMQTCLSALKSAVALLGGDVDSVELRARISGQLVDVSKRLALLEKSVFTSSTLSASGVPFQAARAAPLARKAAAAFDDAPEDNVLSVPRAARAGAVSAAATPGAPVSGAPTPAQWEKLRSDVAGLVRALAGLTAIFRARTAEIEPHGSMPVPLGKVPSRTSHQAAGIVSSVFTEAEADESEVGRHMTRIDAVAAQADFMAAIVQERNRAIDGVVREVQEVAEIVQEISGLVTEQGERLTAVEQNLGKAHDQVSRGVVHLQKAADYQSSGSCTLS